MGSPVPVALEFLSEQLRAEVIQMMEENRGRLPDADIDGLEDAARAFSALPFPRLTSAAFRVDSITEEANAEYASVFVAPRQGRYGQLVCFGCGATLTGLLGSFTWGLAHGEGACASCGWPGRGLHYLGHAPVIIPVQFVLQYHPDEVRVSDAAVAARVRDDETEEDEE